jgi:branched-subunit amino acid aminotransferase/4-amino-4-deoxychorismate lyase
MTLRAEYESDARRRARATILRVCQAVEHGVCEGLISNAELLRARDELALAINTLTGVKNVRMRSVQSGETPA